ncbi:DUF421 domain-containing protein [Cupriavidus numazuensis]|uniref:YetF C-terminal domain-containing protein n=1 Tax=Cupriavidus numazuensis TaxID=221992 RepID=A0ABN7Q2G8_9BURK|nr:YetF domain-containing protein [Cupriavidus numazuensis]CAG2150737.1 hypothetical protein LMG26411_03797 [Cupriavidus numazuensis]
MDSLNGFMHAVLGEGDQLAWWQGAVRAVIVFIATWLLLRVACRRSFAQKTAFDLCVVLLLGAVLSRAVVGATSFPTAFAAALVLVLMHRGVAWLSSRYPTFDRFTGGQAIDLLKDGNVDHARVAQAMVSEEDLKANLRSSLQAETLEGISRVVLERNGVLTFVREKNKRGPETGHPAKAHAPGKINGASVTRLPGR